MTSRNLVKAHWHVYRMLQLYGVQPESIWLKYGTQSEYEFYDWVHAMACAHGSNNPASKALWLDIAGMHRRNIQRLGWLKVWSDEYGTLPE